MQIIAMIKNNNDDTRAHVAMRIPHNITILSFLRPPYRQSANTRTDRRTFAAAVDHDPLRADRGRRGPKVDATRGRRRTVTVTAAAVAVIVVVVVVGGERRTRRRGDSRGRHIARRVQVHHHAVQGDARTGYRRPRTVRQGHTSGDGRHVQVHAKGRQVRGYRSYALRFRADHQRSRRPVPGTHLRLWRGSVYICINVPWMAHRYIF